MIEEWKPLEGNENKYLVCNCGKVLNLNWHNSRKPKICSESTDSSGYLQVGINGKMKLVHILVYKTFIGEIPKGYDVHHKDHNKLNNFVENLCLIEHKKHSLEHKEDKVKKYSKPVLQYTLDGQFVAEYPSVMEASRQTSIPFTNISACCNGVVRKHKDGHTYKTKSAGGFVWKYKEVA